MKNYGPVLHTSTLFVIAFLLMTYIPVSLFRARYINFDMNDTDQGAYITEARELRDKGYTNLFMTGRNRMPLYLLIISPFLSDDNNVSFQRIKLVSVVLSLVCLTGLYAVFRRFLSETSANLLLVISALTVFIYRTSFTQAELLYTALFFGAFAFSLETLMRPTVSAAFKAGILWGIGYLTKASLLPMVSLFMVLQAVAALRLIRRKAECERRTKTMAVSAALFLLLVSPYIAYNKAAFGKFFYNVNSEFYMWTDSWEEAKSLTYIHNDRFQYPDMPARDIPGPAKYFREHTLAQAAERVRYGLFAISEMVTGSYGAMNYGYYKYVEMFMGALVVLTVYYRNKAWKLLRSQPEAALFASGIVIGYTLLAAWYIPVARGNRFVIPIVMPALYSVLLVTDRLLKRRRQSTGRDWSWGQVLVFAVLFIEIFRLSRMANYVMGGP